MRYWITTHDPHDSDDQWYIYLQDRDASRGREIEVGNKVLFYETGNRKTSGKRGRTALVYSGEVTATIRARRPPKVPWVHEIECGRHQRATRTVGATEMWNAVGEDGSPKIHTWHGLREITKTQYEQLQQRMGL